MPELANLEIELREQLIERLHLDHVDPESLTQTTPLFRNGLELDSLDALEITVLVEEEYGIVIGVAERTDSVFGTLGDLAQFIRKNHNRDRDNIGAS